VLPLKDPPSPAPEAVEGEAREEKDNELILALCKELAKIKIRVAPDEEEVFQVIEGLVGIARQLQDVHAQRTAPAAASFEEEPKADGSELRTDQE
jgi:hypothetical protein